ncbi:MAG: hypothetical protein WC389_18270 [Lutibacter sp.]|jgi:hypothetical protein
MIHVITKNETKVYSKDNDLVTRLIPANKFLKISSIYRKDFGSYFKDLYYLENTNEYVLSNTVVEIDEAIEELQSSSSSKIVNSYEYNLLNLLINYKNTVVASTNNVGSTTVASTNNSGSTMVASTNNSGSTMVASTITELSLTTQIVIGSILLIVLAFIAYKILK